MKIFSVQNFGAEFEVGNVLQITFLALLFSSLSFAVAKRFGMAMVSFLLACCLFALQTFLISLATLKAFSRVLSRVHRAGQLSPSGSHRRARGLRKNRRTMQVSQSGG